MAFLIANRDAVFLESNFGLYYLQMSHIVVFFLTLKFKGSGLC